MAQSSACQQLSRQFAHRIMPQITQRMAADCSIFRLSMAYMTVCPPYCSADGSRLLILPLVNSFHDCFRVILLSGSLGVPRNILLVVLCGKWNYSSFVS